MAFDLNKNDGSFNEPPVNKPATSKFDLSKSEAQSTISAGKSSGSGKWIIGILSLLIVAVGIWYFSSTKNSSDPTHTTTTNDIRAESTQTAEEKNGTTPTKAASEDSLSSSAADVHPTEAPAVADVPAKPVQAPVDVPGENNRSPKTDLDGKIPATFAKGSTTFRQLSQSLVKRIISYLDKNPDASIKVEGYASSDGSLDLNKTISQARADAFKKYLVSKTIADNRIKAIGRGIENPIAPNNTNAGRMKNRRVEVTLP